MLPLLLKSFIAFKSINLQSNFWFQKGCFYQSYHAQIIIIFYLTVL